MRTTFYLLLLFISFSTLSCKNSPEREKSAEGYERPDPDPKKPLVESFISDLVDGKLAEAENKVVVSAYENDIYDLLKSAIPLAQQYGFQPEPEWRSALDTLRSEKNKEDYSVVQNIYIPFNSQPTDGFQPKLFVVTFNKTFPNIRTDFIMGIGVINYEIYDDMENVKAAFARGTWSYQ